MSGRWRRDRRLVIRDGRRFLVCGLRSRRGRATSLAGKRQTAWAPGITLLLVLIVSAMALERPPSYPDNPQRHLPNVSVARYTLDDFVTANR